MMNMSCLLCVILVSLFHGTLQSEELSFTVTLKRSDTSSLEEAKSVMMDMIPTRGEYGNPGCTDLNEKVARLEEIIKINRLNLCGAGMQNSNVIANEQITASSYWHNATVHAPYQARLLGSGGSGCWATHGSAVNEWIQVDLIQQKTMYSVVTQGRERSYDQWVTSYNVLYCTGSCKNSDEFQHVVDKTGEPMAFMGNTDRNTPVINPFPQPITARYFRISVLTWHTHISLRFDFLMC